MSIVLDGTANTVTPLNGALGATTPSTVVATTVTASTGIVGTTTNNSAGTGYVGEYVSASRLISSTISMTTGVALNITSISLTAGDWDVSGWIGTDGNVATIQQLLRGSSSDTSATLNANVIGYGMTAYNGSGETIYVNGGGSCTIPLKRYSLASTTTIYLVASANFTTNICVGYGYITARRVR